MFQEDEDGLPRTWGPKVSIPAITQRARQAAAQCLALLAVRRLGLDQVSPAAPAVGSGLAESCALARAWFLALLRC